MYWGMPESNDKDRQSPDSGSSSVGIVVAVVIFMVVLMWGSTTYQFPDGTFLGVGDFILLWFREIIIVGLFVVVGIVWLFQVFRKKLVRRNAKH
jgi:hypothetical protein